MERVVAVLITLGLGDDITVTSPVIAVSDTDTGAVPTLGDVGEALHVRHGDGPGPAACRAGEPIAVTDIATDPRWPGWSADAAAAGVGAVLSMPLIAPFITGALNFWSSAPRHFDDADLCRASDAAGVAAALLHATLRQRHLERAVDGRTVIGQAQGILIERYRLTPQAAFEALSTCSQAVNRKLSDVSEALVSTGTFPLPATPRSLPARDRAEVPAPPTGPRPRSAHA